MRCSVVLATQKHASIFGKLETRNSEIVCACTYKHDITSFLGVIFHRAKPLSSARGYGRPVCLLLALVGRGYTAAVSRSRDPSLPMHVTFLSYLSLPAEGKTRKGGAVVQSSAFSSRTAIPFPPPSLPPVDDRRFDTAVYEV